MDPVHLTYVLPADKNPSLFYSAGSKNPCRNYCSVPQCSTYRSRHISMHFFPKDIELQYKWKKALKIGKPISKYMFVCSKHFTPDDYYPRKDFKKRKHLRRDVIPSLNLPTVPTRNDNNYLHNQEHAISPIRLNEDEELSEDVDEEVTASYYNSHENFGRKEEIEYEDGDSNSDKRVHKNAEDATNVSIERQLLEDAITLVERSDDKFSRFGDFIAHELRSLHSDEYRVQLQMEIQKIILKIAEEDENEYQENNLT